MSVMADYDYYEEKKKKGIKGRVIVVIALFLLLVVSMVALSMYMDIVQLNEIGGFSSVFYTNLIYQLLFFAAAFVVIFLAVGITNIFISRNIKRFLSESNLPQRRLPVYWLAGAVALAGAFLNRNFFYQKALNFINAMEFGKQDPLFFKDIGYYVFERPFLMSLYQFINGLWLFVIIYTAVYYLVVLMSAFNGSLTLQDMKIKSVLRHNLVNIAVLFLIKTLSYKFQMEGVLFSNFIGVTGAGYVDVNIWLNYFRIAPFLIILLVIPAFLFLSKGHLKRAAITIAVFPAVWLVVSLIAGIVQGVAVKPNEPTYEGGFLKYNIAKTREAYKIDTARTFDFPTVQELTPEIINRNLETKNNIRIVDYQATLDSNMQLQSNTNFYNFHNGDIINYTINGKEIPVFITAREIDKNRLPDKSYINTTFKYTHGYGVVMNPINRLTAEGQIDFILKDVNMTSVDPALRWTEPRVYYGETTRDHVIVNPPGSNKLKEIDADGNAETSYNGKAGIRLHFLNRLLFALRYGDVNFLISGNIDADSKLLLNRQVLDRARKAVPFLTLDSDPYILLTAEGRLKWVVDAYTTSANYPYSQYYNNFNYIRNSVKVVIDAYDGDVKYYIIDPSDPIIKVYQKTYPELFSNDPLPAGIAEHSRYPEQLFMVQSEMLSRYHITPENFSTFYTKQDLWEIAKMPAGNDINPDQTTQAGANDYIEPYYNMVRLPGDISTREELILMRPFTPSGGKHNMVSWMAVRNSSENYGEMIVFNFPKNTNILGPYQIESNINAIDQVSKNITLWGQSGSRVFKGSLLVIPIENSVLYVEPIYIQSSGASAIPQVRQIIVGYQRGQEFRYGIGANLDEALNQLFAGVKPAPGAQTPPGPGPAAPGQVDAKVLGDIKSKVGELQRQLDELNKLLDEASR
jgi:uncharacterized protein